MMRDLNTACALKKTSRKLAKRFDEDIDRAGLAGLLHDYAKQIPVTEYRQVIQNEASTRHCWHMAAVSGTAWSVFGSLNMK